MIRALVMAGGRSERMRASSACHKALVSVSGLNLLERNLRMLFASGFRDVVVSVNAAETELLAYLQGPALALASSSAATLETFVERQALGTIGCARMAFGDARTLLVVNVDNLTALDLRAFVEAHERSDAAMTIATHAERWIMPYGELILRDGEVEEYREKPVVTRTISSGTYVLSQRVRPYLPAGRPTSIPQLFAALRTARESVRAFHHDAPWIDVNDRDALVRAEAMIAEQRWRFEPWKPVAAR